VSLNAPQRLAGIELSEGQDVQTSRSPNQCKFLNAIAKAPLNMDGRNSSIHNLALRLFTVYTGKMTRGILITGNESSLLFALSAEAAKRVQSHLAAYIPHDSGDTSWARQDKTYNAGKIEWRAESPVSARALVLEAQRRLDHIDDAVLVCVPPPYRKAPEALTPVEIDRFIDAHIKSWFFLAHELTAAFQSSAAGTLALVLRAPALSRDGPVDLAGPSAAAAFRALAQGLLLSAADAVYNIMGFFTHEPGLESAFAAHIFKTMEEGKKNSGKWHKFGKFPLLGGNRF
jgi:NAD(P)-dependent dehydrogenase (short-subunit alcohol dehydrogenase family)